jgi:ABC-type Mn2+/Zn2+ transport system ATPase subunit
VITINDLSFAYGRHDVLKNMTVELPDQGVVSLTGPNGVGKTTLLKALGGLFDCSIDICPPRTSGSWRYFDADFLSLDHLTVSEFVGLMLAADLSGSVAATKIATLIDDLKDQTVGALSLGQSQRLVLVLALNSQFDVLLLDEPFNALDTINIGIIEELISEAGRDHLVIFATHRDDVMAGRLSATVRMIDSETAETTYFDLTKFEIK